MNVMFRRLLHCNLEIPEFKTPGAAAVDWSACLTRPYRVVPQGGFFKDSIEKSLDGDRKKDVVLHIQPQTTVMVSLGFSMEMPHEIYMQLHMRSSWGLTGLVLSNGTGIVDSDYRGELFAVLHNRNTTAISIKHGERIAQGVFMKCERPTFCEGEISATEREGGFGSTN